MPRKPKQRIYVRDRSGTPRYYGDFRDYSDVGGGQEALIPDDMNRATSDAEVAEMLASDRLEELRELRRRQHLTPDVRQLQPLEGFGSWFLKQKAKAGLSEKYLVSVEKHLERAVAFFGKDRDLTTIYPSEVRRWIEELRATDNGRGGTLSEKTVRDHLNSLSNLYKYAQAEEAVPLGFNPVEVLTDKPTAGPPKEASYLEPEEAALFLEATRQYSPPDDKHGVPFMHALVGTFLLTGGRKSEVLGLQVEDVSFDRETIRFRPNEHRTLKTEKSKRTVPLWPQLREILQGHIFGGSAPRSGLLFPSPRTGKMLVNVRKQLDTIAGKIGLEEGEVRTKAFRHTYASARIQTTEHGHPVALFTVARELGHTSTRLIEERYGHLLVNRKGRYEEVAFRLEDHLESIKKERLRALQLGVSAL